jgi:hypothetical protein
MRRIRGEPVEVWLRHGRPARFVWRGRLYTVLFVLDRRVSAPPQPQPPSPPAQSSQPSPPSAPDAETEPAGREHWLVEATPQQAIAAARYELTFDLATGRWTLARN